MSDIIYLNVKSAYAYNHISELVTEAYSQQISIFECEIGRHIPLWRNAKINDTVIYSIDDIALCCGEISHIKSKAFRPVWFPDHDYFRTFVDFTQSMCCQTFSESWAKNIHTQHVEAIKAGRWIFAVCVVIKTRYHYIGNKPAIQERVREVLYYDDERSRMESPFYMSELVD